ncbi:MAG: hypothetical protein ACI97B_001953 [Verrucomicrobiales bacterium]|jgi:hypothetical protein
MRAIRLFTYILPILTLATLPLQGQVLLTEFMASNDTGLQDEDGDYSDWIELCNVGSLAVNLDGYRLTDDATRLDRWRIPARTLAPSECLVIFASNKDRDDPEQELHTNFKLDADGEYLALIDANGSVLQAFSPAYPEQLPDIAYGIGTQAIPVPLVQTQAPVRVFIPSDNSFSNDWVQLGFDDSSWLGGIGGAGFGTAFASAIGLDLTANMQGVNPSAYLRIPFTLPNASSIDDLQLHIQYDDGFVAYLNGQEVAVSNMPEASGGTDRLVDYTYEVNNTGKATALTSVTLDRGAKRLTYPVENLIGVTLTHFKAQAAKNNAASDPTQALPVPGSRAELIEDNLLSTGIINPGGGSTPLITDPVIDHATPGNSTPGMAFIFDEAVINGPGDDLVFFELHTGGANGDTFHVSPLTGLGNGLNTLTITAYDIPMADAPEIAPFFNNAFPLFADSLASLESQSFASSPNTTGFRSPGVGIDLSEMGYALGASVTGIFIRANGTAGIDPVFLAGLPPEQNLESWETAASADRADALALTPDIIQLGHHKDLLLTGNNLLAIHGASTGTNDTDFLIHPSLIGIDRVYTPTNTQYFLVATPGEANESGQAELGPHITDATDAWAMLPANASMTFTARVVQTVYPISQIDVHLRVMFGAETTLLMRDDGIAPDVLAGDQLYTAQTNLTMTPGEMIRWRYTASDTQARISRLPFFTDPLDADEYFGTIAEDLSIDSLLPVVHWFVENPAAANNLTGTRGALFYLNRFYDNIQTDRHGQSSGGFPKKSYDIDFNKGNRFIFADGEKKVKDINFITNWADKSKTRNTLGYETVRRAGAAGHFSFPIRIQQNGSFFSVADMVEDGDENYLDRTGLDPEGALYKMYNRLDSATSGAEKKTRKEENNDDLQALITGLTSGTSADQITYVYDHVNLAEAANYYAMQTVYGNHDFGHKNYYMYRDTNDTGEWWPLNWDVDLSFGHRWNGTDHYFDDRLLINNSVNIGVGNNRLREDLYAHGPFYQMFTRRLRTLLDQLLQAPGTPINERFYETRMDEIADLIDPVGITSDADLDYAKWGSWGDSLEMRPSIDRLKTEFLEPRRKFLYVTNSINNGGVIPDAQAAFCPVSIAELDYLPASGNQDEEYIRITHTNTFAVDISYWMLTGAVDHVFTPGTVLPAYNAADINECSIYVVRDPLGFRARAISPTGNELHFLQGGYKGQLSARGESVTLVDASTNLVDSFTYAGTPTELQVDLRITEINYHPANPTPAELLVLPAVTDNDFEYLELMNIGASSVDVSRASFTEGVTYTFPTNIQLAAGAYVILARNAAAFELRYGTNEPVFDLFTGNLDNKGERLTLQDAVGENILSFSYEDAWQTPTDGGGRSLVITDPNLGYQSYAVSNSWRNSGKINGSPGWDDSDLADLDQDGMADSWEMQVLGSTAPDGTDDGDFDGMNDLGEYVGGTAPGSGGSVTRILSLQTNGVSVIALPTRIASGTGYTRVERRYTLESTDDLARPFTPVPGMSDIVGDGSTLMYSNLTREVRYFRGSVELR